MSYILELLPIMPFAVIITAIIYGIFLKKTKNRRGKLSKGTMFAEYLFTGWILMFLYVTQLKSFGNGLGQTINMIPFKSFCSAFQYGVENGKMIWQFLLNITMFLPLGFLLPIIFPKKCRKLSKIILISFLFTLGTELTQLVTMRGTDIDDIIANTLGGVWGYTLYLMAYAVYVQCIKDHEIEITKYKIQMMLSAVIVLISVVPYILLEINEARFTYGVYYYGNVRPRSITNMEEFSDGLETDSIYQYYELQSLEELKEELRQLTGFEGEYRRNPESETWVLEDGNRRIFIYDHNTWSVTYHHGEDIEKKENNISFEAAVKSAEEYLGNFNIDTSKLTVIEKEDSWSEFNTIEFSMNKVEEDILYYGNIRTILDDEGNLLSISNYIITGKTVANKECISPRRALQVTQSAGLNEFDIEVTILSVDKGYSIIKSTGYIIPTWKIAGEYEAYGKEFEYSAEVSALEN